METNSFVVPLQLNWILDYERHNKLFKGHLNLKEQQQRKVRGQARTLVLLLRAAERGQKEKRAPPRLSRFLGRHKIC